MLHVGLTGGIGAGKSTVAAMLSELGATIIDADGLAREVVGPGTVGLGRITDTFGLEILQCEGTGASPSVDPGRPLPPKWELNRAKLGEIVFGDEARLEKLNQIVHPLVRLAADEERMAAWHQDPGTVIVEDIPLLAESGGAGRMHFVIVVQADVGVRLDRLKDRGLPNEQALARIASQASDEQRAAIADVVVTNNESPESLRVQLEHLWQLRLRPYRDALISGKPVVQPGSEIPHRDTLKPVIQRLSTHFPGSDFKVHNDGVIYASGRSLGPLSCQSFERRRHLRAQMLKAGFVPSAHGYRSADPGIPVSVVIQSLS